MGQNHKDLNAKDNDMATINKKKKPRRRVNKEKENGEIVCKDLRKQKKAEFDHEIAQGFIGICHHRI